MNTIEQLSQTYEKKQPKLLEDYLTFLRFKSISADSEYREESQACADWLKAYLTQSGFKVEQWDTAGNPSLFASYHSSVKNAPTLLLYTHYDVQPIDPIELWESPPFEPRIKEGLVYARGAQDNKGQCFYTIAALKSLIEESGGLPIHIKLIIDGEEEIGSPGLTKLLQTKKEQLKADYVTIVDLGILGPDSPAVTLGCRGIITMDVIVQGTRGDLHSGSHGGVAFNPIHALIEILSKLRDPQGKVLVPGFYDDVAELSADERKLLALEFDQAKYKKEFGSEATGGEKQYTPFERAWLRPTLEINGIYGGYSGKGFKTVIPAVANAKISCRLVPNQVPSKISQQVKQFIEKNTPNGVQVTVHVHEGGGPGIRTAPSSKIVQAFATAYGEVFKKPCQFILEGGSIPITNGLREASGGELAMMGFGLATDQIHAPNEHFSLDRLKQGFLTMARTIALLGENKS